jgi:hypothetical protein
VTAVVLDHGTKLVEYVTVILRRKKKKKKAKKNGKSSFAKED